MNAALANFLPFSLRLPRIARRAAWIAPSPHAAHTLDKGATLVVVRPAGVAVHCHRGALWLTHDGDSKDIMLSAGDSYTSDSDRRLLVHALEDARAQVTR